MVAKDEIHAESATAILLLLVIISLVCPRSTNPLYMKRIINAYRIDFTKRLCCRL